MEQTKQTHAATTASKQSSTAAHLPGDDPHSSSVTRGLYPSMIQSPGGTFSGPGKIVPNISTSFCFQTILHADILRDPYSEPEGLLGVHLDIYRVQSKRQQLKKRLQPGLPVSLSIVAGQILACALFLLSF